MKVFCIVVVVVERWISHEVVQDKKRGKGGGKEGSLTFASFARVWEAFVEAMQQDPY
jgi:hypothetical protein